MAKTAAFVETWDGTTRPARWTEAWAFSAGGWSTSGGKLALTTSAEYRGWSANGEAFDLTGSTYTIGISAATTGASSAEVGWVLSNAIDGGGDRVMIGVAGSATAGNLQLYTTRSVGGVTTETSLVPVAVTAAKFVRFRESGGQLYFEYSGNGTAWTNIVAPIPVPISLTALYPHFYWGRWGTGADATFTFEGINESSAPAPQTASTPLLTSTPAVRLPSVSSAVTLALTSLASTPTQPALAVSSAVATRPPLLASTPVQFPPAVAAPVGVQLPLLVSLPTQPPPAASSVMAVALPMLGGTTTGLGTGPLGGMPLGGGDAAGGAAIYPPSISVSAAGALPFLTSAPALFAPAVSARVTVALPAQTRSPELFAPSLTRVTQVALGLLSSTPTLRDVGISTAVAVELERLQGARQLFVASASGPDVIEIVMWTGTTWQPMQALRWDGVHWLPVRAVVEQ